MYTKELAIGFWDNSEKATGKYENFNIEKKKICKADIKESVRHAFRDLTVRTMKKAEGRQSEVFSLDDLAKSACDKENGLLTRFVAWFEPTDPTKGAPNWDTFKAWHIETCNWVIGFLKEYYAAEDCTYGKAQKIVNMSFKNLYALCEKKGIAEHNSKYFKHCHVPLDSFTLEWFHRECIKREIKIKKGHISNWSAVCEYGDKEIHEYTAPDGKTFYTYFYFQQKFREWFNGEPLTPLMAEFVYWPRIQKELAAEGFLFSLIEDISQKEKEEIKKKSLEEKIAEIKKIL